jgi:signal transduction histidine kinase/ActR/RegA family two-component response regulator
LEERVAERTRQLESSNRDLQCEVDERLRVERDLRQSESRQRQDLGRFELLDRITRAVGQRQDLKDILQIALSRLEDELPIEFGCVCLYDAENIHAAVASVGERSRTIAEELKLTVGAHIPVDQNGLARCVQGRLVYEPDLAACEFPFPQLLASAGLLSLVAVPLLVESRVFAVLLAARRAAQGFTSGECEFLRQLSEHVALAAHQAQLYGALQHAYEDLRKTQFIVMQQERLRALGQMASGIAHDINNALSPAALYVESLLERESDLKDSVRQQLAVVHRAIEDVANTVARLREFYRSREPQLGFTPVELNRTVDQVIALTKSRWHDMPQERGAVIRVETQLEADLPKILGAESEIRDALVNLVLNAVDAMPTGGTLAFHSSAVHRGSAHGETVAASHVQIEVRDTGNGMDEATRGHCLEPFFTTKGERGTGLGLAMVYGTVQRHGAEIEIDTAAGRGTTMRVIFPMAAKADLLAVEQLPASGRPGRSLRILVIDDDPLVTQSLRDTLEADGHVVVTADGGQQGIDAFTEALRRDEAFSFVITDLGMPYVDGRQVASAIKAAAPGTSVVLLTGWGHRILAEHDIPDHVDRVLSKPPKLRELRKVLEEVSCETRQELA